MSCTYALDCLILADVVLQLFEIERQASLASSRSRPQVVTQMSYSSWVSMWPQARSRCSS